MNEHEEQTRSETYYQYLKEKSLYDLKLLNAKNDFKRNLMVDISKGIVKGLFFLNGAAAIAVLYNYDTIPSEAHKILTDCALGALLALCSGILFLIYYTFELLYGYLDDFNEESHIEDWLLYKLGRRKEYPERKRTNISFINCIFLGLGMLAVGYSMTLFWGALYTAYTVLKPGTL